MDTATHFVMGVTIGGVATLDPAIAASPTSVQGIMIAAIVASQVPDIDTILKLQNNAKYIRNHRGITHSIPAVLSWSILVSLLVAFFFPTMPFLHLWLWTLLAVVLHVVVDIFNAYGTQALRPFSNKWIALGVINTFDPIIFSIHAVASAFILFRVNVGPIALTAYILTIAYYIIRIFQKQRLVARIHAKFPNVEHISVSPAISLRQYHIAIVSKSHYYVGKSVRKKLILLDTFERVPIPNNDIIHAARKDENIAAFLSFSPVYRWDIFEYDDSYEVRFIDLRYRTKDSHYPFVAIVHLDKELRTLNSYTGWIFSEEKLKKKLDLAAN
ncbi:metal-dependent hydrolase [Priestia taiwanensis]|uniref:Membrane protein n=1 Tax=Priestia taiwanensis TaxID=1347902 RepID=A0A917AXK5_9BACI|nr:metal-dependent hydrolase [Priestia taiwanensis]MBM7364630.1 inner membrane protein [Priestia taiwanensis]GGE78340.1 membrane protein [Priestia taiwanensis]